MYVFKDTLLTYQIFEDTVLVVEQAETIAAHIRSDNLASFKNQCCSLLTNNVTSTITLLVLGFIRHNKKRFVNLISAFTILLRFFRNCHFLQCYITFQFIFLSILMCVLC